MLQKKQKKGRYIPCYLCNKITHHDSWSLKQYKKFFCSKKCNIEYLAKTRKEKNYQKELIMIQQIKEKIKKDINIKTHRAKLIGHLLGDGSITKYKKKEHYEHKIRYYNTNKKLVEDFVKSFDKYIGQHHSIFLREGWKKPIFSTQITNKIAHHLLSSDIKNPDFNTIEEKQAFLQALFDDEGSVQWISKTKSISFYNTNIQTLLDVKKYLNDLGIETTKIYKNKGSIGHFGKKILYSLRISKLKNLREFYNKIGFVSDDKREKLKYCVLHLENVLNRKLKRNILKQEAISLARKGKHYKEIANKINIPKSTICEWVKKDYNYRNLVLQKMGI